MIASSFHSFILFDYSDFRWDGLWRSAGAAFEARHNAARQRHSRSHAPGTKYTLGVMYQVRSTFTASCTSYTVNIRFKYTVHIVVWLVRAPREASLLYTIHSTLYTVQIVQWIIQKKTGFNLYQSRHCAYIT